MKRLETGEVGTGERDIFFKKMQFKQIKNFEEIAEGNIDKYKKLKMLE